MDTPSPMDPTPVEYRPSRVRMAVLSAFLILLTVGDVWMLTRPDAKPDERLLAVVGLLVFAPGFVATLFPLVRPRALLRLDAEGVAEWGHFGGQTLRLPWSEVARVEPFRWRVVPMLALVPFDEGRTLAEAAPSVQRAAAGNRRTYGQPFVIDARMYGVRTADVQAEIERRLAALPSGPTATPRSEGSPSGNIPSRR